MEYAQHRKASPSRRHSWLGIALATALALQILLMATTSAQETGNETDDWEVWALDQGSGINRVHIYQFDGNEFVEVHTISFADLEAPHNEVQTPHMISFDESNRYAAIASTASGTVSIVRTSDYEVIETLETGATAHMAHWAPAPDNSIWVSNIGAKSFTQITADLDNEVFEISRDIDLPEAILAGEWPGWVEKYGDDVAEWPGAVCHEFTPDGQYAYVTLGPMAGGLVVVDLERGEIERAFDPNDVLANCGVAYSPNHEQMYANWSGDMAGHDDPQEAEPGEWYVFDTTTHELTGTYSSQGTETQGIDPHGTRVSPDGTEMWQVNRVSNDGIVVDTATQEIIDEFQLTDTPDIIGFSPDGEFLFATLRGPNPTSMPHVAVGNTPGIEVIDVASRESVAVLQPAAEDELDASDFHGINIRGPIGTASTGDDAGESEEASSESDDDGGAATPGDTDDTEDLMPAAGSFGAASAMTLTTALATIALVTLGLGAWLRIRVSRA